jgi:DNA-binding transcriptional LysR family regulator
LVALDALLRARNVTHAGRELGLSQPAMSAALGKLRELFADPLFERVGARFLLTPLAEALVEPLQAALSAIQRTLHHQVAFDPAASERSFAIAMSDHLLVCLGPQLVARMNCIAPQIRLQLQPINPEIGANLAARRVDASIQPANLVRDCVSQSLGSDRWICATWRGNRELPDRISVEQLGVLPQVSFRNGRTSLAEQLLIPTLGKVPVVQVTSRTFACLPFMLRGTALIALFQRSLALWAMDSADIRIVELPIPMPVLSYELSWNAQSSTDPAHTWLRAIITDVAHSSLPGP